MHFKALGVGYMFVYFYLSNISETGSNIVKHMRSTFRERNEKFMSLNKYIRNVKWLICNEIALNRIMLFSHREYGTTTQFLTHYILQKEVGVFLIQLVMYTHSNKLYLYTSVLKHRVYRYRKVLSFYRTIYEFVARIFLFTGTTFNLDLVKIVHF